MNPKEWTRIGLIMEIRQVWRDYGRPQLKGLDRVRKCVLYKFFLRELSFDPCECTGCECVHEMYTEGHL